jgi:septal ring factor EnvC (AmiA/AmiB activator)
MIQEIFGKFKHFINFLGFGGFVHSKKIHSSNKLIALFAVAIFLFSSYALPIFAATEQELRSKADELNKKVSQSQEELSSIHGEVTTLEGKLASINAEIATIDGQINKTKSDIKETQEKLEKTEAELQKQQRIIDASVRSLYKNGNISTIELLAASDNFTEFVNEQEYLSRIKTNVQVASKKVKALKKKLEDEKKSLDDLRLLQEGQKKAIEIKHAEQADLLAKAQDKEFSYSQYVGDLKKQESQAESALLSFLVSQQSKNTPSQGHINSNQLIGYTGSTGNSTGPHLHFGLWDPGAGQFVDPVASRSTKTLKYGFSWPYTVDYPVSRWFDCTQYWAAATRPWCPGGGYFHAGIDVAAPAGSPIRAIGPGEIIRSGYFAGSGNTVVIQHANGYQSVYYHMQ